MRKRGPVPAPFLNNRQDGEQLILGRWVKDTCVKEDKIVMAGSENSSIQKCLYTFFNTYESPRKIWQY